MCRPLALLAFFAGDLTMDAPAVYLTMEPPAVDLAAVEELAVEELAVEELAVEELAVEELAVEDLAVEELAVEELDVVSAEFLSAHNRARAAVGVAPLVYDTVLAESAQAWAETLAREGCAVRHDTQRTYGENTWWSSYYPRPNEVVDAWAEEGADFDYAANRCRPGALCGHYTQVVWADTTAVGCGSGECGDGEAIWVCRYNPPGNWTKQRPY